MRFLSWPALALAILAPLHPLRADDEACSACDLHVLIDGPFRHVKNHAVVRGQVRGNAAGYAEEIVGPRFTLSVQTLPAGLYTISIGEAETDGAAVGARLFDVTVGGAPIARGFDIAKTAGGPDKACQITGQFQVAADAADKPVTIEFVGRVGEAKFNTLDIRDISTSSVVTLSAGDLADPFAVAAATPPTVAEAPIWRDPAQPIDARVSDLVRRMSLAEKVSQIRNDAPAIPRLCIPAYNYWSEALHGVAAAGIATVFPQAIGMAATWDPALIHAEADVIATEGRAKYNDYTAKHNGNSKGRYGLTFWSPNVNIFRDPRWGRGQETYGEDPLLTGTLAVAFIHGLQGDDPDHMKAMACAKHFAVHSGPEPERHRFNAVPPERDLYETYLPQFEMAVRDGHVGGVMGAYNSLFGVPACASTLLLRDILRQRWGFQGYIVSDCGAIHNIFAEHKYVPTQEQAAAVAVKAGCDICCGKDYDALVRAVQEGLIKESEIDVAVTHALKTRFQLGLFDPPAQARFARIGIDQNDTPAHAALALKVAEESVVLLKNDGVLPLDPAKVRRIAVIGENADSIPMLVGNYNGTPSHPVTILAGIKALARSAGATVTYEPGCPLALLKDGSNRPDASMRAQAVAAAQAADVVVYVGGISARFEGEENHAANGYEGFDGGDRTRIELPPVQTDLLRALQATGKPVVFVNCSGSAMAMPWEAAHLPAIVQAWYPGEEGGRAVAEVLFGQVNPAARLPVTFYRSTEDLPGFEDYSMRNRTYRYFQGAPLYAFGHGLSYTTFGYEGGAVSYGPESATPATVTIEFTVRNTGRRDGDEVAQVYFRHVHSALPQARLALCGYQRVHLAPGESTPVKLEIPVERLRYWDAAQKRYVVEPGRYEFLVGGASDDIRLRVPAEVNATPQSS